MSAITVRSALALTLLAALVLPANAQDIPLPAPLPETGASPQTAGPAADSDGADQPDGEADAFERDDELVIPVPGSEPAPGTAAQEGGFFGETEAAVDPAEPEPEPLTPLLPVAGSYTLEEAPRGERLVIQGEQVRVDLVANLIASATAPTTLILRHQSGADLLPERSRVEVLVNGQPVGVLQLSAFTEARRSAFTIPPGLVTAGRNQVSLRGYQIHRVLCGPEAGWELWTAIDLAASGFEAVGGPPPPGTIAPSLIRHVVEHAVATGAPIGVRIGEPTVRPQDLASAIGLASWLGAAMPGTPPRFNLGNAIGNSDDGVLIIVDPTQSDPLRIRRTSQGVVEIRLGLVDAQTLIALLNQTARVEAADDRTVATGDSVSLRALGVDNFDVRTHRAVLSIPLPLSPTLVMENDRRGDIVLDAAYAPNLPDGSQLAFLVNGTPVRTRPLEQASGELISGERHPIPFRLLHGGMNEIAIVATIEATDPSAACPPIPAGAPPFAAIFDSTRIELPPTVPAYVFPDLGTVSHAAAPFATHGTGASQLALAGADDATLVAAMTLTARLSGTHGAPLVFAPRHIGELDPRLPAAIVAATGRLSAPSLGLDPALLASLSNALVPAAADRDGPPASASVDDLLRTLADRAEEMAGRPGQSESASGPDLPTSQREWAELVERRTWMPQGDWLDQVGQLVAQMIGNVGTGVGLSLSSGTPAAWIAGQPPAFGALIAAYGAGDQPVVVLTAANSTSLPAAAQGFAGRAVWDRLAGDIALLPVAERGGGDPVLRHLNQARYLHLTEEVGAQTLRPLAAQAFSLDPGLWFAVVFALILIGAVLTHFLVRRIGERGAD